MKHELEKRHRRSIRLKGYDYANAGAYFVTIVTQGRACLFGEIANAETRLNQFGRIVKATWNELPHHYSGVGCDAFVVMPNHIHCVIGLVDDEGLGANDVGAGLKPARGVVAGPNSVRAGLKPAPTRPGLPEIIRGFITFSARRINELRETRGVPVWQRNYYEHVIRDEESLNRIRKYILDNPAQWAFDPENPAATAAEPPEIWRLQEWREGTATGRSPVRRT
jgi:REP element-mobilizing transposase RayT